MQNNHFLHLKSITKTNIMLSRFFVFLIMITFFACSSSDHGAALESSYTESSVPMEKEEDYTTTQTKSSSGADEKEESTPLVLLREGHCRLKVENMDHQLNKIQFLVNSYQGYVSDLTIQNSYWQKEATFLIRVPAEHFQNTLDSIKSFAEKVEHQRISTQDVTEEYVDISSRLETKRQVRDRYIDILRNKAKTVEEILLAEEKIRHLQEEIESREGRLRYLKDRASMSTVTVELYEQVEQQEEEEDSWLSRFLDDAGSSLGIGGEIIRSLVLGLMAIWPILLIVGLLVWRRKAIRSKLFGSKK